MKKIKGRWRGWEVAGIDGKGGKKNTMVYLSNKFFPL